MEDPREVAWQAHDAVVAGEAFAVPQLLSLAEQWQPLPADISHSRLSEEQKEERYAMAAVLDALIQLDAQIPAETLRRLAPDFPNAVAVTLARMPVEQSIPLSLKFYRMQPQSGGLQYVSAALLALHPKPEFVAQLFSDITVYATVFAISPHSGGFGAGFAGDCFQVAEPLPEDWPTIGQYKFSTEKSEGASVLVLAPKPVYASRVESAQYLENDCGMSLGVYLGSEQRRAFIAEMLGVSAQEIAWESYAYAYIEFDSLGQFSSELRAFADQQQQVYRGTADALRQRGLLDASAAPTLPLLQIRLQDMREDHSEPISKDAIDLPTRVEWSKF